MRPASFFAAVLLWALAICTLCAAAAPAIQDPPNQVINEIWRFGLGGNKTQSETYKTSIGVTGLYGPIPKDDPGLKYLLKIHNPAKPDDSGMRGNGTPVVLTGWQKRGQEVRIEVQCPSVEQLGTLRAKTGGTHYYFRPTKRLIWFRVIRKDGFNQNEFDQQVGLKVDNKTGVASWTPAKHVRRRGQVRNLAPVVIGITVTYVGMYGLEVEGNPKAGWQKKTQVKHLVGWLVLPVCGNIYGDHMAPCPLAAGPVARWQSMKLGGFSLAVPDNWNQRLSRDKTQGTWSLDLTDPPSASILLTREDEGKIKKHMKVEQQEEVSLNGMPAKLLKGRITGKKADVLMYVFQEKDDKGLILMLAAMSTDWKTYGPLLKACMGSLQKGPQASLPTVSADPPGPAVGVMQIAAVPSDRPVSGAKPPEIAPKSPATGAVEPQKAKTQPEEQTAKTDSGGPKLAVHPAPSAEEMKKREAEALAQAQGAAKRLAELTADKPLKSPAAPPKTAQPATSAPIPEDTAPPKAAAPDSPGDLAPVPEDAKASAGVQAQTDALSAGKPGLKEQEALAQDIFKKLQATAKDDLDSLERLYTEVIQKCPDTPQAETSHRRLSSLYLKGFDPPRLEDAVLLLEGFLAKYPGSDGVPQVRLRLASVYERLESWCDAARVYRQQMPQVPASPDPEAVGSYVGYATALERCNDPEEAKAWYALALKTAPDKKSPLVQRAKEGLARLGAPAGPEPGPADKPQIPPKAQAPEPSPKPQDATAALQVSLIRKRGFADHVGRGERPGADGSVDARFKMSIKAPDRVITAISIRSATGQNSAWDTLPGNGIWLVAVTQKRKLANRKDGSIEYTLPQGTAKFDLWVQDNNSIAGGKTSYVIKVEFAQGPPLEAEVLDKK